MKRTVINLAKEKSRGIDGLKGTGVPAVRIGTMSASSEGRGAAGGGPDLAAPANPGIGSRGAVGGEGKGGCGQRDRVGAGARLPWARAGGRPP